jgi:syntaxin 1B/2/3
MDRVGDLREAHRTRPVSDQPVHTDDASNTDEQDNHKQQQQIYTAAQLTLKIPTFLETQEQVSRLIQKINRHVGLLEQATKRSLTAPEAMAESQAIMAIIERTIAETTKLLDTVCAENKELEGYRKQAPASLNLRLTKTASLKCSFSRALKHYQRTQSTAKKLIEADLIRQYKLVHPNATKMELSAFLQDEPGARKHLFSDVVRAKHTRQLQQMEARMRDMAALNQSITSLALLFKQLQSSVEEQQILLDGIEGRMGKVEEDTEMGKGALEESVETVKRRQRRKYIVAGVVVVVVLLVVVGVLAKVAPLLLLFRSNQVSIINTTGATAGGVRPGRFSPNAQRQSNKM